MVFCGFFTSSPAVDNGVQADEGEEDRAGRGADAGDPERA